MFSLPAQRLPRLIVLTVALSSAMLCFAGDLRMPLPKKSKATPVQKLNQEGVRAVEKHDYLRAKKLFYKAYLIDPNDPFTLNNLGYIAELDGDLDRAQRFYALAAEQPSEALVEKASNNSVVGKPVDRVAGNTGDQQMLINRMNVNAMSLLEKDRAPEADLALQKALALDPKNPFTLNNLGYAKEKEGELEQALSFYLRSAALNSTEPISVSMNRKWRGRPISSVAAENAKKVTRALEKEEGPASRVARLNLQGVSAVNRNERKLARQYFEQAYKLDPQNAFTLNNMGYVAELEGDRETADYFYAKAKEADRSNARVSIATRKDMEGQKLGAVATTNDRAVIAADQADLDIRRRQGAPPVLLRRDNSPVIEPAQPPPPEPALVPRPPVSSAAPAPTLPVISQPAAEQNGPAMDVLPPLPDTQQPGSEGGQAAPSNSTPPAQNRDLSNQPVQGVIPPLPESDQPSATQPGQGPGQGQAPQPH